MLSLRIYLITLKKKYKIMEYELKVKDINQIIESLKNQYVFEYLTKWEGDHSTSRQPLDTKKEELNKIKETINKIKDKEITLIIKVNV